MVFFGIRISYPKVFPAWYQKRFPLYSASTPDNKQFTLSKANYQPNITTLCSTFFQTHQKNAKTQHPRQLQNHPSVQISGTANIMEHTNPHKGKI